VGGGVIGYCSPLYQDALDRNFPFERSRPAIRRHAAWLPAAGWRACTAAWVRVW